MKIQHIAVSALAGSFLLLAAPVFAADKAKETTQTQTMGMEPIYGNQLLTEQERLEIRNKMRNFKTNEEREKFQLEHHKQMQSRAKEKGVTLPDEPGFRGGMGQGGGMRPGGGMGSGGGTGTGGMGSGGK